MSRVIQPTLEECRRFGFKRGDVIGGHEILPPIAGASDFRLSDGMDYENAGMSEATSGGTTVTAGAANTKGSWVQLSASTSRDATGMYAILGQKATSATGASFLIDIGIGAAGSEQVLLPNLLWAYTSSATATNLGVYMLFPISVPAGSRLSTRCQSNVASATLAASCFLTEEGMGSQAGFSRVTDYGTLTASSTGTTVTGGAANTKGSWTQLTASSTNACTAALIQLCAATSSTSATPLLVDIGVGASGSEQVVAGDLPLVMNTAAFIGIASYLLPLAIASGTRLSARVQSPASSSSTRIVVYGID